MESKNGVSIEAAVATALGITSGLISAWVIYSLHLPNGSNYWGFAPTAISFLVYAAIAALRLSNVETPIWKLVLAVIAGLTVLMTVGSVLIIMIGCRYDACINL
jgi:hypothetical protein